MRSPAWVSGLPLQEASAPVLLSRPLIFVPPIPLVLTKSWYPVSARSFFFGLQELPAQHRFLLFLSVHLSSQNFGSARKDLKRRIRADVGSERSAKHEVVGSCFVAIHRIPPFDSLNRQTDSQDSARGDWTRAAWQRNHDLRRPTITTLHSLHRVSSDLQAAPLAVNDPPYSARLSQAEDLALVIRKSRAGIEWSCRRRLWRQPHIPTRR
jgi:hypothetical protein